MKRTALLICGIWFCLAEAGASAAALSAKEAAWLAKASRTDQNGWICLHLEGEPYQIGFQRGWLTARELGGIKRVQAHQIAFQTARDWDFFKKAARDLFKGKIPREYRQEMRGIADGARRAGVDLSYDDVLLMNGILDISWYWWPQQKRALETRGPGCSAFVATGKATADGQIVMAHNSWTGYADGRFMNLYVDLVPERGHRIAMQAWGPSLYSSSDFFITGAGLIGTETTIGGFKGYRREGVPVFVRARRAMQYADDIDGWAKIMTEDSNGAYANSWLLGDVRTGEIARFELGLKHHSLEKKSDGWFTGSNVTDDVGILREETDAKYDDVRDPAVARRVRWGQLMRENEGRIDVERAEAMLGDHYDVYLERVNPSNRTICGHGPLDDGGVPEGWGAFGPGGAVDGKVLDSSLARQFAFWGKWGSSCDIGFDAKAFLAKRPQYEWEAEDLGDLPVSPWTLLRPAGDDSASR
jgi:hypothetical protein